MEYIQNIRDTFCYEPLTGKLFWTKRPSNRIKLFDEAGCKNGLGYIVTAIKGRNILAHRLIFEILLGRVLRDDEIVDHVNGVKDDNRLENLRVVDRSFNAKAHRKKTKGKTSKYMGVFQESRRNRAWVAKITDGDTVKTRYKKSEVEAAMAYDEMARAQGWPEEGMNFTKKERVS